MGEFEGNLKGMSACSRRDSYGCLFSSLLVVGSGLVTTHKNPSAPRRRTRARASSASHTVAPDGSFCVRFVFSPGEVTSVGRLGWGERNVTPASKESGRARRSPSPRPGDTVGSDHTVDAENLQSSALRTEAVRSDRHCAHPSSPRLNQISRELAAPRGGEGGGVSTSPRYF